MGNLKHIKNRVTSLDANNARYSANDPEPDEIYYRLLHIPTGKIVSSSNDLTFVMRSLSDILKYPRSVKYVEEEFMILESTQKIF